MANIIAKAYDASKKIITSIFLGKPNLFTTSDVNRYIEQTRAELDFLHRMVGFESDFSATLSPTSGSIPQKTIVTSFSYMRFKGMSFSPSAITIEHDFSSLDKLYVVLRAKTKRVTFSDDQTHEIAGATFDDNSAMAAADQMVMYDEKLVMVTDCTQTESGFVNVGVLGVFVPYVSQQRLDTTWYRIHFNSNCTASDSFVKDEPSMDAYLSSAITGNLDRTDSVQKAVSKLNNRWNTIFQTDEEHSDYVSFGSVGRIRVIDGSVRIFFPNIAVNIPSNANNTPYIVTYSLDTDIKGMIIDKYDNAKPYDMIAQVDLLSHGGSGLFVPLSTASIVHGNAETACFGQGRFGLFMPIDSDTNHITDCYFIAIIDCFVKFGTDIDGYGSGGGPIWTDVVKGHTCVIHGASVEIPLFGTY